MKKNSFLIVLLLIGTFISCSKEKSYEPLEIIYQAEKSVNDNTIITDKIAYNSIIGYDTSNYVFLLDSNSIKKIRNYFFPSSGLPFSVNVYAETIYLGKFFPSYSNNLSFGITIDPEESLVGNKLIVKIDYGFCRTDNSLVDQRNDKRIISILQRDNKLMKIDI